MIVAIHQPEHLPWLGFFNKMVNADAIIILDNVQYRKRYFQNRNKILVNGLSKYIGVPVKLEKYREKSIADMEIYSDDEIPWKHKYLKTIEYHYKKHPYFYKYYPFYEDLVNRNIKSLYEFNMEIIYYYVKEMNINTKIIKASDLSPVGKKSDLILNLIKHVGADVYLSGSCGRDYIEFDKYKSEKVKIWFNDFKHPVYVQKGSREFVSHLSTLDLLMNVGAEHARNIIQSGTKITKYGGV